MEKYSDDNNKTWLAPFWLTHKNLKKVGINFLHVYLTVWVMSINQDWRWMEETKKKGRKQKHTKK